MPETWYTSDQHFGHANIIKYCDRPFVDPNHMTEMLVLNHNALVAPDDMVYMLGDFSLGVDALKHVGRLNGDKILIAGNHDKCWAGLGAKHEKFVQQYLDAGFDEVWPIGYDPRYNLADGERRASVHLCHFPFQGDSHDGDRYGKWRPVDDGRILLCGHVHTAWKVSGRQINVGVDVWDYRPVHATQILDIIETIGEDQIVKSE